MDVELNKNQGAGEESNFEDILTLVHLVVTTRSAATKLHKVMLSRRISCPKIKAKLKINHCSEYFQRKNRFNGKIWSLIYYDGVFGLQAIRDNSKVQPHIQNAMKTREQANVCLTLNISKCSNLK